jgi:Heparinase II/III-like protein/Heparinase II/III N-terminus
MAAPGWYLSRAAAMSPREVIWRLRTACLGPTGLGELQQSDSRMLTEPVSDWGILLQRFRDDVDRPVLLGQEQADRIAAAEPAAVQALIRAADRLSTGERSYFGYPSTNIGTFVDWSYDPLGDYRWPAIASRRIDHRVAGSDPKWIWELNRLQHLPVLAQAWLFTGESRYADLAFEHLDSWIVQNPVGQGIAWRGAFEAGIRAISIAVALQGLKGSPALTDERFRRAVRVLDASARYCWQGRSRFSSANNHLVGELAGLVVVHLLFPELAAPASWSARAIDMLAEEADRQILADGAGAEQSISYQIFTAELFAIVAVLSRLRGDHAPAQLTAALDRSSRYLASLVGDDDPDPRYGDDDDGFALRLGVQPKRTVREHLAIAAAAAGQVGITAHPTMEAAWYASSLSKGLDQRREVVAPEVEAGVYARDGGLVVLRSGRRRLTMDIGPLGYLSIAAHGHADALAVTLSSEGRDLIVDPGTASYYGNPAWRTAHRSTRAHPTVCVDGLDQSVIAGPFLWSRHANVKVRSVDLDRGIVDAEHHGYLRLDDPVVHRRWLIAPHGLATVVVVDLIDGRAEHDVVLSWPLHPDLDAAPTGDGHLVTIDDEPVLQLCHAATAPIELHRVKGDPETHLGWFSDRLEHRTPAWLVGARCKVPGPVAVLTLMQTVDAGSITNAGISMDDARAVVTWSEKGVGRGLTIDRVMSGAIVRGPFSRPETVVSSS